jgi:hypothetical protein
MVIAMIKVQGVKRPRNCVPIYSILTKIIAPGENNPKIIPNETIADGGFMISEEHTTPATITSMNQCGANT